MGESYKEPKEIPNKLVFGEHRLCSRCHGTGRKGTCKACDGRGYEWQPNGETT